jgi:sarcosine oxidase
VLGIDQFHPPHNRGSSHGHTRIIRRAYYEHPSYVPLVRRAFEKWYCLEQHTGRHLLTTCDCLTIGPAGGELVAGVRRSAGEHKLAVESLTASDIAARFPVFQPTQDLVGLLEHGAGILYVEDCVDAHCEAAVTLGAEIRAEEAVHDWKVIGDGVEVRTARGTYYASRLVVTAGAWATRLVADAGVPLTVMRQVMLWFAPDDLTPFRRDRFPVFLLESPAGSFYGLPALDRRGLKVCRHYGAPELPGPDGVDWMVRTSDEAPVRDFLRRHIPAADGRLTDAQVCLYTLSPNRHFVVDLHPRHPQVAVACGFSGHGFKFAPVVAEALADLAETGSTALPIDLFRQCRSA